MPVVLGINIGTRHTGIALLRNAELVDWNICSFPKKWSPQKCRAIVHSIGQYIDRNKIHTVSVKIPDTLPVSIGFTQLIGALNVLFEEKGMEVHYYTLSDLKEHFCLHSDATKSTLAECIVQKYPDLLHYDHIQKPKLSFYYSKVFEAVAAAYKLQAERNWTK